MFDMFDPDILIRIERRFTTLLLPHHFVKKTFAYLGGGSSFVKDDF
jgi:hypothetical protein